MTALGPFTCMVRVYPLNRFGNDVGHDFTFAMTDAIYSTEQALSTFVYKVTEELLCHDLILRSRASIYVNMYINNITRIKVYKN
jgi:hypothetical protein